MERVTQEKDLGVVIDMGGKQAAQCQAAIGKANGVLGCIRRGIIYKSRGGVNIVHELSEATSRILCAVLVTTIQKDIDAMERVQRRVTRLIPGLARLSYEERLKETGLYTLERRWLRGDMMEMFKIMKGRDKISEDELFNRADGDRTRGHSLRVKKRRVKTVVRPRSHLPRWPWGLQNLWPLAIIGRPQYFHGHTM